MTISEEVLAGLRWGGYPRISEDPKDLRTGVTRQIDDITVAVTARGADPREIRWYTENDTSAYRKKRVRKTDPLGNEYWGYRVIRPKWHAALADLRSGAIDALMAWDLDRIARDPRDLEDAIEVVMYYGKRIEGTTGSVDLRTDNGIAMARVMVAMGNKSSADTGRRVKRAHRAAADSGTPVGGARPFGWLDDKRTPHPVESRLLQEAVAQIIDGEKLATIVSEWTEAGIVSTRGNPFTHYTLKQILRSPRLTGWRTHKGVIVVKDEDQVRGAWEPLLDQETFDALQLVVCKPTVDTRRRQPRRDRRHYLLTGTIRCGICNRLLYGSKRGAREGFDYSCSSQRTPDHRLSGSGQIIDRMVRAWVYLRMSEAPLEAGSSVWVDTGRIGEINEMITEAMAELRAKRLSSAVVFAHVAQLEEEREGLEAERDEAMAATLRSSKTEVTAEEFLALDDDGARPYVEKYLEALILQPAAKKQHLFDERRLDPVWREDVQPQRAALG